MKLTHISLTARDARRLSAFYVEALGFRERRPPRRLSGDAVARGNGLPGVSLTSHWLTLPEGTGPFLEIMEYSETLTRPRPEVNAPGYGHLAFAVPDLAAAVDAVLRAGGTMQGEITNLGTEAAPCRVVYVRDPEGNILELEQR